MTLPAEIEDLIASLKAQILALQAENSELRRRLGLDSSNSSKPPSSDGLKKKPRILGSLRGRSDKQSGGQKGHQGGTLRQVANPDAAVRHEACACGHCGAALDATSATGIEKRQVFDIPERPLLVTEHQATIYHCMRCRGVTKATFPEGVVSPTQYGERIKAAAIYLNVQQLIPEDRAAQALSDLFGAPLICPASIVAWVGKKARELCQVYEAIGQRVAEAGVRHLDETGYRIAGKLHWLHSVSSLVFTHYRVSAKRGDIPIFLSGGTIVHDHFKPYYAHMSAVDAHALCGAHHLRELKAIEEIEKEPWARAMSELLNTANRLKHEAQERGETKLLEPVRQGIIAKYKAIVAKGFAFHKRLPPLAKRPGGRGRHARRPGNNLLLRLRDFQDDVLRFIADFAVPFTNNQAEQDLRMMKVRMKISGAFRTIDGAQTFADIRSVISTARKHGLNILDTLSQPPNEIIAQL